jgi:hypothetical protein
LRVLIPRGDDASIVEPWEVARGSTWIRSVHALELWDHVTWIIRNPDVYELKRSRAALPDLEGLRLGQIRRAARRATTQQ